MMNAFDTGTPAKHLTRQIFLTQHEASSLRSGLYKKCKRITLIQKAIKKETRNLFKIWQKVLFQSKTRGEKPTSSDDE